MREAPRRPDRRAVESIRILCGAVDLTSPFIEGGCATDWIEDLSGPDSALDCPRCGQRCPGDVVGCVLITEFTDLPARGEDDAPLDPDAGAQWANPHPDGRPARLAAGVRRSGEHLCAFRIKGDGDFQVRNEMAGDIVTALLGTF